MAVSGLKVHGGARTANVRQQTAEVVYLDHWRKPPVYWGVPDGLRIHPEHWLIGLLVAGCYAVALSALL